MIEKISIDKKNEVYMLVQAEPGIEQEISEYFTFFIPFDKLNTPGANSKIDIRYYS